jgi:uncharacterized protein (TIGR03435 family)
MKSCTALHLTRGLLLGAAFAIPLFVGLLNAPILGQSKASGPIPKFEVATVKPCAAGRQALNTLTGGTPGRLTIGCSSLRALITSTYVFWAGARWNQPGPRIVPIEKQPAWAESDLYSIEAKAEGTPSKGMMNGPMMEKLLQDRFRLKLHTELRQMPVYFLTVAAGGPKLKPSVEGSCHALDSYDPLPVPKPGERPTAICALPMTTNGEYRITGATMDDIAVALARGLGVDVIDKTGMTGKFDVRIPLNGELAELMALSAPPPGAGVSPTVQRDPDGPMHASQFLAQRMGLKLASGKGPGRVLVIDHVERPSEN